MLVLVFWFSVGFVVGAALVAIVAAHLLSSAGPWR